MDNNYLQHYGILGMKWGVRRYQNKDGSLTSAGKKRLAKLDAERETLTGKKSSNESTPKKWALRDVPDQELQKMVSRRRLENDYLTLTQNVNKLTPKHVSAGKRFVDYVTNKVVIPAATDASKNFATKFLNAKGDALLSSLAEKAANKAAK